MGLGSRISYRGWQFWKVVVAKPLSKNAEADIRQVLSDRQMLLFLRQSMAGQQHGYRVMQNLLRKGRQDQDLLAAALLHDVGKIQMKIKWWDRPLVVLVQALFPEKVEQWGKGEETALRRPFIIKMRHPEWGAEYAKAVACTPLTIELIRRHQDPGQDNLGNRESELLAWLQWSDDRS